jgi:Flp pilus assembly protein TadG
MKSKITTSARRRKNQRGNAFVEFGLAMMPYFALVFGTLDFGMAIFIDSTIQSAAREGVRFAITYNTTYNGTDYGSQTAAVKAVAQSVSMGFLNSSNANTYLQVNYYLPTNLSTPITASQLPQTLPDGTVVTSVNQTGNVVEVRVQNFPWNWMVPLPGFMGNSGLTMTSSASDVLQGLPPGASAPPTP